MMEKHHERRRLRRREAPARAGRDAGRVARPEPVDAASARARLGVGTALVGSGENVAARLREYVDDGIDTFILSGYPHLEEAQRFGRYVMPHFRGEAAVPDGAARADAGAAA